MNRKASPCRDRQVKGSGQIATCLCSSVPQSRKLSGWAAACVAIIFLCGQSADLRGAVVISNAMAINDDLQVYTSPAGAIFSFGIKVQGSPLQLTNMTVRLRTLAGDSTVNLDVRSDPLTPSATIASRTVTSATFENIQFNLNNYAVAANQDLWLTISSSTAAFQISANTATVTPANTVLANFIDVQSGLLPGPLLVFSTNGVLVVPTVTLNGEPAAVPEPGSLYLLALSTVMLCKPLSRVLRRQSASVT